jgi:CHAD domain-containing protein
MIPARQVWESRTYEHLLNNIDAAMQQLHRSKMTDAAVHDARKALKKARAALRLLQGGIARTTYRAENILLRDAGRYLSAVRDAKSLLGALNSLRDQQPNQMPHSGVAPLQKAFRTSLTDARRQLARGRHLARCIRLLEDARSRAARLKFAAGSKSVQSGLHRVYRKGRKALAEAKNNPTPDALHEWRKQVKYLFNMVDDSLSLRRSCLSIVAVQRLAATIPHLL